MIEGDTRSLDYSSYVSKSLGAQEVLIEALRRPVEEEGYGRLEAALQLLQPRLTAGL